MGMGRVTVIVISVLLMWFLLGAVTADGKVKGSSGKEGPNEESKSGGITKTDDNGSNAKEEDSGHRNPTKDGQKDESEEYDTFTEDERANKELDKLRKSPGEEKGDQTSSQDKGENLGDGNGSDEGELSDGSKSPSKKSDNEKPSENDHIDANNRRTKSKENLSGQRKDSNSNEQQTSSNETPSRHKGEGDGDDTKDTDSKVVVDKSSFTNSKSETDETDENKEQARSIGNSSGQKKDTNSDEKQRNSNNKSLRQSHNRESDGDKSVNSDEKDTRPDEKSSRKNNEEYSDEGEQWKSIKKQMSKIKEMYSNEKQMKFDNQSSKGDITSEDRNGNESDGRDGTKNKAQPDDETFSQTDASKSHDESVKQTEEASSADSKEAQSTERNESGTLGNEVDEADEDDRPRFRKARSSESKESTGRSSCRAKSKFLSSLDLCLWVEKSPKTFEQAKERCQKDGGILFLPKTESRQSNMRAIVGDFSTNSGKSSKNTYWIGLVKNGNTYEWIDGSTPSWFYWSTDMVDNAAGTDCVVAMSNESLRWLHQNCNEKHRYVCQLGTSAVDGGWSDWQAWSACSVTCGTGTQKRLRICDQPMPSGDGQPCVGEDTETSDCNSTTCPVDGDWSAWQVWSTCSVTCGTGKRTRSRSCDNPAPSSDGQSCDGSADEEQTCTLQACPVDGGWSAWQGWSTCSVTCGTGKRTRSRSCDNPAPSSDGQSCDGSADEEQTCTLQACPVDGGWSAWQGWSTCSVTCGTGKRTRSRSCDNPAPSSDGQSCDGSADEEQTCTLQACPVDGGWSAWQGWSTCSVTCGTGKRTRSRSCDNPAPSSDGRSCDGSADDEQTCTLQACPAAKLIREKVFEISDKDFGLQGNEIDRKKKSSLIQCALFCAQYQECKSFNFQYDLSGIVVTGTEPPKHDCVLNSATKLGRPYDYVAMPNYQLYDVGEGYI